MTIKAVLKNDTKVITGKVRLAMQIYLNQKVLMAVNQSIQYH